METVRHRAFTVNVPKENLVDFLEHVNIAVDVRTLEGHSQCIEYVGWFAGTVYMQCLSRVGEETHYRHTDVAWVEPIGRRSDVTDVRIHVPAQPHPAHAELYALFEAELGGAYPESGLTGQAVDDGVMPLATNALSDILPSRAVQREKWAQTWRMIRVQWTKQLVARDVADWLARSHPSYPHSRETVGKIIKAGSAGLLDN